MIANEKAMLALETIDFPVFYDNASQVIKDSKGMMVCDIRGWSKIQFMLKSEERQDAIGELVAVLLNKYHSDFEGHFESLQLYL
ncbi:hypothetical protein RM553_13450 [Zunongwangia sp. F363]|uniref:Uncharacterized protein n=1 Tax=Autumnicola tepida TaxID=3075595 RepID=A0ABU3CBX8_9FLAO|nr:hypothetical protein [Zunongwangia sp. F363]MDT0643839.1 hypothetical protein [Zunongwangia sp. F363]